MSTLRAAAAAGRSEADHDAYHLWRRWVWANLAGWAIGWVIYEIITENTFHRWPGHHAGELAAYVVGGLLIGTAQWNVFLRTHRVSVWWIAATARAAAVARWLDYDVGLLVFGTLGLGFFMGSAQWLFLRRLSNGSEWWVVASTVAFLIAGWIGTDVGQVLWDGARGLLHQTLPKPAIHNIGTVVRFGLLAVQGAVQGALFGAMTGVLLVRLLRGGGLRSEGMLRDERRGLAWFDAVESSEFLAQVVPASTGFQWPLQEFPRVESSTWACYRSQPSI